MFEPIVTTVVKVIIRTCFPDLLFLVLFWEYMSEAGQCLLHLYFSNYVDEVLLLLPLLGGIQVFMMTMKYLWEALCEKKDTDSQEDKQIKSCTEGCEEINTVCSLSIAAGVLP